MWELRGGVGEVQETFHKQLWPVVGPLWADILTCGGQSRPFWIATIGPARHQNMRVEAQIHQLTRFCLPWCVSIQDYPPSLLPPPSSLANNDILPPKSATDDPLPQNTVIYDCHPQNTTTNGPRSRKWQQRQNIGLGSAAQC